MAEILLKEKAEPWKEYLRSRAIRLLCPVAIFYGLWLIGIGLAVHVFNVDLPLMEMFLAGIGMPLWFVVALSSLVLLAPNIIPSPGDEFFWLSRFLLLVPVFGIVLLISLGLARFEAGPKVGATPKPFALLIGVVLGTVPSFVAMEISLSYSQIVWGFLFLWISIWLLIGKKSEKEKI